MGDEFLKQKGDFRRLRCFQLAEHLYDITFVFSQRFIPAGDRTKDQMVQAARSIKQNIAEGSCAATMSTQSEMLLTNVGKSSQQELLLDYEDYLVTRGLSIWSLDDRRLQNIRQALCQKMTRQFMIDKARQWSDETLANVAITLIHQCDKMLVGLLEYQKRQFMENGGIKEQMTRARLKARDEQQDPQSTLRSPACPKCGGTMRRQKGKSGDFWGCCKYPLCNGSRVM